MYFTRCRNLLFTVLASTGGMAALADPPTFQITSLYSSLDGTVQYVVLTETAGMSGQHRFTGLTLTATHNGITKEYTFAHDLPSENTAHASIVIGAGMPPIEIVGSASFPYLCCAEPAYQLPLRFLPTDGGTVEFAGVDRVSYAKLPTDGVSALLRDGNVARGTLPRSACPPFLESN